MKKIYILVETNDVHEQRVDVFDDWRGAEAEMVDRVEEMLKSGREVITEEDKGDFYDIHFNYAWVAGDISGDGFEYDWHIYEREV